MWWSYVLALGGAAGFFMMRCGMWQGFAWSTLMQAVWLLYSIVTGQWGFLFGVALYGTMSVWGWYSWKRTGVPSSAAACTCPCACGAREAAVSGQ
jgi:hypothetical protein